MSFIELGIIALTSFLIAGLTFFSGFGLGTLLLPVFTLFLPVQVAVAATAVVHLGNNLFKAGLVGKYVDRPTLLRFGLPAILFALVGAAMLGWLNERDSLVWSYIVNGYLFEVTTLKLLIGLLILGFAAMELNPVTGHWQIPQGWLSVGGALSGFFGGLSGHQGAFRSVFLIRMGLGKEGFVALSAVTAVFVDIARLAVYGLNFYGEQFHDINQYADMVTIAIAAAMAGTYVGKKFLAGISLKNLHQFIGVLLMLFGLSMVLGWI
jgi:uncharacterized protein